MANEKKVVFAAGGLEALTNYVKSIRSDLTELVGMVNDTLQEIGGAVITLDESKAYITANMSFTLASASWAANTGSDAATFPYKYTLALNGVTADTRVDAVLDAASSALAGEYGMSAVCETADDAVIFRSASQPTSALTGTLYITQGAEVESST